MKPGERSGPIAVAGAGIAGLSAAIALKLAGFPVEVFERETALEPVGAGIQMGPNATRIMEGWALDLLGAASEPDAIELRSALSGSLLNAVLLRRIARARYGAPYFTILRSDLQKALLSRAAELGIAVKLGCPVTAVKAARDAVRFEAGSQSLTADALIGADGMYSPIRRQLGTAARLHAVHTVAWRAILAPEILPAYLRNVITLWMAPGAHLVLYPVSGGAALNGSLIVDDCNFNGNGSGSSSARSFLLKRLSNWAELPLSILDSTDNWHPWALHAVEKWPGGEGRIQAVGDAWHAMRPFLASGGVMAVEDGAALGASLAAAPRGIVQGLRLFRKQRERRVWRVARASAQMGRIYHCPQPFDIARDFTIRAMPGSMLLSLNNWLYGG